MALGTVLKSWSAPANVVDLAFDEQYLWLIDQSANNRVHCYTRAGVQIKTFDADWMAVNRAIGIAFDGVNLWLFEYIAPASGKMYQVTRSGVVLKEIALGRGFSYPIFDGKFLWAVAADAQLICCITRDGVEVKSFSTPAGVDAGGLAFDGQFLYHTDLALFKLYCLTRTGVLLKTVSTPSTYPIGLTFDGQYIWHYDAVTSLVYMLSRV